MNKAVKTNGVDDYGMGGFDPNDVKPDLYQPDRAVQRYVIWSAEVSGGQKNGYFFTERGHLKTMPPGWTEASVHLGSNPNKPPVSVGVTTSLEAVVLGARYRGSIRAADGQTYYYPRFTRRSEMVPGDFKSQAQLWVVLPGHDPEDGFVMSLNGQTRSMSWDNANDGASGFPLGAYQRIAEFVSNLEKQKKAKIPWQCAFSFTFVPAKADGGKSLFVNLQGTWVNPFTVVVAGDGCPRFVGREQFLAYQEFRANVVLDWESEWQIGGTGVAGAAVGSHGAESDDLPETEEDEIPF